SDTARVTDRLELRDADHDIVTRRGDVALLIVGEELRIQLTDQGLREIEEPDMEESEDGLAARLFGAMIRAGVRELMDNAVAYPISELGRAEYVDDRLVIEDLEGEPVFDITANDRDIMTDFRERDARRFARELRERMQE
ncbi:MAG: hypothetical protein ACN0LA_04245, partial [Candidatus Longimicrobiales bacterium M2_2A_002]